MAKYEILYTASNRLSAKIRASTQKLGFELVAPAFRIELFFEKMTLSRLSASKCGENFVTTDRMIASPHFLERK